MKKKVFYLIVNGTIIFFHPEFSVVYNRAYKFVELFDIKYPSVVLITSNTGDTLFPIVDK